jgi:hypothetical protein
MRQYCKIANTEEGMEMLMEHTLQRQMTEMKKQMKEQMDAQMAEIATLTSLLKTQLTAGGAPGTSLALAAPQVAGAVAALAPQAGGAAMINAGSGSATQIGQIGQLAQTIINIRPWDGDDFIQVPVTLLAAAFTENPRLAEFCRMGDTEKSDPEIASPYITEALVDITRRAHADPVSRNIYLNPKRTDQVMVCLEGGQWEVRALNNASRTLFDGIVSRINKIILSTTERTKLPFEIQASACYVPMLYNSSPEEYVQSAKPSLSAHLANTAPRK